MHREDELAPVDGHQEFRAEVERGLRGFLRHRVDVAPALIVLSVLEDRIVEGPVLFADHLKVLAVASIAAQEEFFSGGRECKCTPEGTITEEGTTREVARRKCAYTEALSKFLFFVPIELDDVRLLVAPAFKMRADTKSGNYFADLRDECFHRLVVEVVVVIVRDDKHINVRNIARAVLIRSCKILYRKGEGRCIPREHGVDEKALPVLLDEVRGMPEPDEYVFLAGECMEIDLCARESMLRFRIADVLEKEFLEDVDLVARLDHHGCWFQIVKFATLIVE